MTIYEKLESLRSGYHINAFGRKVTIKEMGMDYLKRCIDMANRNKDSVYWVCALPVFKDELKRRLKPIKYRDLL